jgi:hypothetical protein
MGTCILLQTGSVLSVCGGAAPSCRIPILARARDLLPPQFESLAPSCGSLLPFLLPACWRRSPAWDLRMTQKRGRPASRPAQHLSDPGRPRFVAGCRPTSTPSHLPRQCSSAPPDVSGARVLRVPGGCSGLRLRHHASFPLVAHPEPQLPCPCWAPCMPPCPRQRVVASVWMEHQRHPSVGCATLSARGAVRVTPNAPQGHLAASTCLIARI